MDCLDQSNSNWNTEPTKVGAQRPVNIKDGNAFLGTTINYAPNNASQSAVFPSGRGANQPSGFGSNTIDSHNSGMLLTNKRSSLDVDTARLLKVSIYV